MNDDFDYKTDFEFEDDFEDELADLAEEIDSDEDLLLRTAILQKNELTALLCIKSAPAGAAICRVDPRESFPSVQLYEDREAAMHWFSRSLRTSKKNGWNVVYDGLPLQG